VGAHVDLGSSGLVSEFVLFGEDASRVLISCDPEKVGRIQQIAIEYALSVEHIGNTAPDNLEIRVDGKVAATVTVSELRAAWDGALAGALHVETEDRLVPSALQRS
jgi:hypothetical protein